MFEGLKNKLREVRSRFGASLEETIQEAPLPSPPEDLPKDQASQRLTDQQAIAVSPDIKEDKISSYDR